MRSPLACAAASMPSPAASMTSRADMSRTTSPLADSCAAINLVRTSPTLRTSRCVPMCTRSGAVEPTVMTHPAAVVKTPALYDAQPDALVAFDLHPKPSSGVCALARRRRGVACVAHRKRFGAGQQGCERGAACRVSSVESVAATAQE